MKMTDREKLINLIMQKFGWEISPETEYKIIINANLGELVDALVSHGVTMKEMQKPLDYGELINHRQRVLWMEGRDELLAPVRLADVFPWGTVTELFWNWRGSYY